MQILNVFVIYHQSLCEISQYQLALEFSAAKENLALIDGRSLSWLAGFPIYGGEIALFFLFIPSPITSVFSLFLRKCQTCFCFKIFAFTVSIVFNPKSQHGFSPYLIQVSAQMSPKKRPLDYPIQHRCNIVIIFLQPITLVYFPSSLLPNLVNACLFTYCLCYLQSV